MKAPQPSPAAWYPDPYGPGQRYFDGVAWTDRTSTEPVPALVAPPAPAPAPGWRRVSVTIGLALVMALLNPFTDLKLLGLAPVPGVNDGPIGLIGFVPLAILMAVVGPYISYRRRDWLLMLIPVYGYFLMFRIGWRLAYLPYRDWAPRPDEAATWQPVRHPSRPDSVLYRRVPAAS